MKFLQKILFWHASIFCILSVFGVNCSLGRLKSGQTAPLFALKDLNNQSYELSAMKDLPMLVLYFFDVASKSSQEGLFHLDALAKKFKEANLSVWGITRADKNRVKSFIETTSLSFPILFDTGKVSEIYSAKLILPTVCIIGPDLLLLDYFQGGGKATQDMLVTLAERTLHNRKSELAKAISTEVVKKNPENVRAKSVQGYIALKEGDLKSAEKTFYDLSQKKNGGELLGKEGLAKVYAQKGQPEKAMHLTRQVESQYGQRSTVHVIKGDLLYSQNRTKDAEIEYRRAVEKSVGDLSQSAVAYNQIGRILAIKGKYSESQKMYEKAISLDPYFIEATSNKGMIFERQGDWDKALEAYRCAQVVDRNDPFTLALIENARKMLLLEKDDDKHREMEQKIDLYIERYRENTKDIPLNSQDSWTSKKLVITLVEPLESGGLSTRDGFGRLLTISLASQLNASGRVSVIEPVIMEHIIETLNLKPNDMTASKTLLRLANAFKAQLICKGTLFHLSEGTLLNLKLIKTVNPQIVHPIQHQFASAITLRKDLHWLNRQILTTVMTHYPLQGYVVEVKGNQVLLNLGADQGVVSGALFDVVEIKPPIIFKGKTFQPDASVMATIEIVRVDQDFAYGHILDQRRPVRSEDKLRERISQFSEDNQRIW